MSYLKFLFCRYHLIIQMDMDDDIDMEKLRKKGFVYVWLTFFGLLLALTVLLITLAIMMGRSHTYEILGMAIVFGGTSTPLMVSSATYLLLRFKLKGSNPSNTDLERDQVEEPTTHSTNTESMVGLGFFPRHAFFRS